MKAKRFVFTSAVLFALSTAWMSQAALRTWDGGGGDNFWTNAANWSVDTRPAPGDDLHFPSGAARLNPVNNFPAGTVFGSITFSGGGYFLQGAAIVLNAGMTNLNGFNSSRLPVILGTDQTFSASAGYLEIMNDIDTAGHTLNLSVGGSAEMQINAPVSGTGGITKTGLGLLGIGANNSYFGLSEVLEGIVVLTRSNALGLATAGTTVSPGAAIGLEGIVTVGEPLTLAGRLRGPSSDTGAVWSGPITLVSNAVVEANFVNIPLIISGAVSGTGSLTKLSIGIVRLTANNTYSGPTTIQRGILTIDGNQPASAVTVHLGATLKGNGTVGDLTSAAGFSGGNPMVVPGELGIGRLTTSNLLLSAVTRLTARLNGTTAATGYGQLRVNGSVNITNAALDVAVVGGFVPAQGNSFIIIDNDGNDAVLGEFRDFPEGHLFDGGGFPLQITYRGGTGNDVVITRVTAPATAFRVIQINPDRSVYLQATGGVWGAIYKLWGATNMGPSAQWMDLGSNPADNSGAINFFDADAPSFSTRFYRVLSP